MFEQAIRHFLERQAHVLVADLLGDVFSLQVEPNRRYFCLLSKNRNPAGATSDCGSRLVTPIGPAATTGSRRVDGVDLLTDR